MGAAPISKSTNITGQTEPLPPVSQLRWRCRRGMLELDVMLRRYLDQQYDGLETWEKFQFVQFLEREDDQLWDWLSGRIVPEELTIRTLVEHIRQPA